MWFIIAIVIIVLLLSFYLFNYGFYYDCRMPKKSKNPDKSTSDKFRPLIEQYAEELNERPHERVIIMSQDILQLSGRYFHIKDDAPIVLMAHGYKSSGDFDFCAISRIIADLGYNMLIIDERACGESQGRVVSFGIKERYDIENWINYICERFGDDTKIILYGVSMGAATVMASLSLSLPENVIGIVEDCGFTSPKEIILNSTKSLGAMAKVLYPFLKLGGLIYGRFNIDESSAIESVKNTKLPALIIHGGADGYVPHSMGEEINRVYGGRHEFVTFENAAHALSCMTDPEKYRKVLTDFLPTLD